MQKLRCFPTEVEMVSSTVGSLWSRAAQAAQLPAEAFLFATRRSHPLSWVQIGIWGQHGPVSTCSASLGHQNAYILEKHINILWTEKERSVSADLQVACSGCRMWLGDVLLFFFFSPLPPSHIAVSCSAGHLPTFRQQLHKNSFFSWNLGPLLMCDLQR